MDEIKEMGQLMRNIGDFAGKGAKCVENKRYRAVECYEHVYGKDYRVRP